MARKFTEDETLKLVQLYREQENLWNIRCDTYRNKQMRTSALQHIQKEMGIEGLSNEDIKNKIKNIRSTYYLELDKIEKSTRSGGGGNVYVPKVKWFEELNSFIKNVTVRRATTDNAEAENVYDDSESSENQESTAEKRTLTPSLRSKRRKLSKMASMINDLKNIDESMAGTDETEYDVFGKSVSAQLKKLSEEQAIIAQEKIQSILTQSRLADIRAKKSNSAFSFQNPGFSQWYQPALYCPPPEISPSGTTNSSSNFHHNENSDSPDESTQANQ